MKLFLSLLIAGMILAAQEQPNQPPACPEALPGSVVTITIAWGGKTAPITMPAEGNAILNKFVADQCTKYAKDLDGIITGTKDGAVPQDLWTINLIVTTYVDLVKRIVESNPAKFAPDTVKKSMAAAQQAAQEANEAAEQAAKDALQVTGPGASLRPSGNVLIGGGTDKLQVAGSDLMLPTNGVTTLVVRGGGPGSQKTTPLLTFQNGKQVNGASQ